MLYHAVSVRPSRYRDGITETGIAIYNVFTALHGLLDTSPNSQCGLRDESHCIGIIYLTNGRSNGPLSICEEVECLCCQEKSVIVSKYMHWVLAIM